MNLSVKKTDFNNSIKYLETNLSQNSLNKTLKNTLDN